MKQLTCLWCLMLSCLFALPSFSQAPAKKSPNIIFILADDLGYETIRANGGESYQTPNIDQLAVEGMRFEHCYAQPQCTPSRVQLMTGMYNVRNYISFGELDTSQVTIPQLFRKAGYVTGAVGKWQLGKDHDNPNLLGFDDYLLWQVTVPRVDSIGWDPEKFPAQRPQAGGRDNRFSQPVLDNNGKVKTYAPNDYGPKVINDYALDFIEKNSKAEKPFYLFYSMLLTHCPFSPTPDSPEWMKDDTSVMSYKGNPAYFGDMVKYMDKMVGNVNAKLNALGIAENTLVIFTGDNGTDVPIVSRFKGRDVAGAKTQSIDGGTHVPLIAKWAGGIEPGTTNYDLVDFSDFMPTMLEAGGVKVPDSLHIDGISYLPQLNGEAKMERKWVYDWYQHPARKEPKIFARNHQYKLYTTGEFYDVPADELEKHPISYESLDAATKAVYHELQKVLANYDKRRLDAIPGKKP
ncbi:MAG: sulfatase-like hydrolase/transferase [Saprospiraceae bacterium]